ncbi:MAG: molybdopterin-dependent oxidoreductase [Pseudomonadota bacterium]
MTLTRRKLIIGGSSIAAGGLVASVTANKYPLDIKSPAEAADAFTYTMQRLLLSENALVREFDRSMISKNFPAINTTNPENDEYQRLRKGDFEEWRLPIDGLVERPMALSLADLKRFTSRTQITQHNCVDGWSAIAEWTGVQIFRVLNYVGMKPEARFIGFECWDGWWQVCDMVDAFHPQSMITYGMNGGALPIRHGAPVRLRLERQLGYRSLKYVKRMTLLATAREFKNGRGTSSSPFGYQWHAGI